MHETAPNVGMKSERSWCVGRVLWNLFHSRKSWTVHWKKTIKISIKLILPQ